MTIINSKEFATNQKKFYEIALNERVFIKRGKNMFYLTCVSFEDDEVSDLADAIAAEKDENISVDDYLNHILKIEQPSMKMAAERLYVDYMTDENLTAFTQLDCEDFY